MPDTQIAASKFIQSDYDPQNICTSSDGKQDEVPKNKLMSILSKLLQ